MIRKDMTNEQYHAAEGISKSTLDLVHMAPALIDWKKAAPVDQSKLETFNMGHAVHCAILEPERFKGEYLAAPKVDRRTKAGKQEYAEFLENSKGKTVLSADDYTKVKLMRDSALAHPEFRVLYDAGFDAEQSIFWNYKNTDLVCKCRHDFISQGLPLSIDIKSTSDIDRFSKSVAEYRYHVQDAHYSDGAKAEFGEPFEFYFLAVSTTISGGRYPVRLFELSFGDKAQGLRERNEDLETIAHCQANNSWPGIEQISLPQWARDDQYIPGGV